MPIRIDFYSWNTNKIIVVRMMYYLIVLVLRIHSLPLLFIERNIQGHNYPLCIYWKCVVMKSNRVSCTIYHFPLNDLFYDMCRLFYEKCICFHASSWRYCSSVVTFLSLVLNQYFITRDDFTWYSFIGKVSFTERTIVLMKMAITLHIIS